VLNSLCKRLWTRRKADYVINEDEGVMYCHHRLINVGEAVTDSGTVVVVTDSDDRNRRDHVDSLKQTRNYK
jgi:hypothetical protein